MNKITNEVLKKWKEEIGKLNIEKGWRSEQRSIEDHCALLHSEVSEAFEDYRNNKDINEFWYEHKIDISSNGYDEIDISDEKILDGKLGKPCGIPSELADIVIRALDMADEYDWKVEFVDYNHSKKETFPFLINLLHEYVCEISHSKSRYELEFLIGVIIHICNKYEIDLYQQIEDKISYNKTRPARHGGKKI